jgi:hypothetical protein
MTAAHAYHQPEPRRPPFADATPAEVRAALIPEEVPDFDRQWHAALTEAAETQDLSGVARTLDTWRLHAWNTQALGRTGYRRMLARAEYTQRTGNHPPGTVVHSADEVRALIQERLGR